MEIILNPDPLPGFRPFNEPPPEKTVKPIASTAPPAPAPLPVPRTAGSGALACDAPGCGRTFKNEHALQQHKEMKHKPPSLASASKPFQCSHCPENFPNVQALARHVKSAHPKKTQRSKEQQDPADTVQCPLCQFIGSRLSLSAHFREAHPRAILSLSSDPFECVKCGRTFHKQPAVAAHALKEHGTALNNWKKRQPSSETQTDRALDGSAGTLRDAKFFCTITSPGGGEISAKGTREFVLETAGQWLGRGLGEIKLGEIK